MSKMRKFRAIRYPAVEYDVWLHRDHIARVFHPDGMDSQNPLQPRFSCAVSTPMGTLIYLVNTPPETVAKWVNGEFDGE